MYNISSSYLWPLLNLFYLFILFCCISCYFSLFAFPHTTLSPPGTIVKHMTFFNTSMYNFIIYNHIYVIKAIFVVFLAMKYFNLKTILLLLKMKQMFPALLFKSFWNSATADFFLQVSPHCTPLGLVIFETQVHPNPYKLQKHTTHAHFLIKRF